MKYLKMVMVVMFFCGLFCGCEDDDDCKDKTTVGTTAVSETGGNNDSQDNNDDDSENPLPPPPPPPPATMMKLIVSNGSAHTVETSFNGTAFTMTSGGSKEWTYDGSTSVTFSYDTLAGYNVNQTLAGDKSYYGLITDSTTVPGTVELEISSF